MKLTHPVAQILARAAEREARVIGVPMAIAVADGTGALIHFSFMDQTLPVSRELAVSKAYTAAALRMSTRQLGELAAPGKPLYGIQHTHQGRLVLFGGGFPLCIHGEVAGAVGISGGTVEEDEAVARPAIELFSAMVDSGELLRSVLPCDRTINPEQLDAILQTRFQADEQSAAVIKGAILLAAAAGQDGSAGQ